MQGIVKLRKKKEWSGIPILLAFLLFFYGPLLYMSLLAFARSYSHPDIFPSAYGFSWWAYVFGQSNTLPAILNSFLFAFASTLASCLVCIPAAYALARFEFRARKAVMFLFLLGNAFPKIGMYTSMGIIFYRIGLMGSFLGVLLVHMLGTMMMMIWLPAGAFRNVPRHLEESARDAGAGPVRTFFSITLPVAWPGIAVACLYAFIGSLGESVGTLFIGLPHWRTMMTEMYGVILDFPATAGAVFALLLILPNFLILMLMRRYIGADTIAKGFKIS